MWSVSHYIHNEKALSVQILNSNFIKSLNTLEEDYLRLLNYALNEVKNRQNNKGYMATVKLDHDLNSLIITIPGAS